MHKPAKIMVIVLISNAQFKRAGLQVKQNLLVWLVWLVWLLPFLPRPIRVQSWPF
jgi:hypothetical protein